MENKFEYMTIKTELEQSEFFKEEYEKSFDLKPGSQLFSDFTEFRDVAELLNQISVSYHLTEYQRGVLQKFFIGFDAIRTIIDPQRLKSFDHGFNDDDELVLFRYTNKGLVNIIINPDECFALSFIPKSPNNAKSLTFYEEDYTDFEGIAYQFFS